MPIAFPSSFCHSHERPPTTRDPSAFLLYRYHGPGMTVGLRGAEKASRGKSVCRLWGRAVCGCARGQPSLALCRQTPGRTGVMQHRGQSCRTEHSPASPRPHALTNQVRSAMRPPTRRSARPHCLPQQPCPSALGQLPRKTCPPSCQPTMDLGSKPVF